MANITSIPTPIPAAAPKGPKNNDEPRRRAATPVQGTSMPDLSGPSTVNIMYSSPRMNPAMVKGLMRFGVTAG